jgi:hypothetical protein
VSLDGQRKHKLVARARWQLGLCGLALAAALTAATTQHALAAAPLRVVLRVASDTERTLPPRLRGQLSDIAAQLVVGETAPLEAALSDQIEVARALATLHHADVVVWCAAAADAWVVHIALPRSGRLLTRRVADAKPGALSSDELETAAVFVRSALAMHEQGVELGVALDEGGGRDGRTGSAREPGTREPSDHGGSERDDREASAQDAATRAEIIRTREGNARVSSSGETRTREASSAEDKTREASARDSNAREASARDNGSNKPQTAPATGAAVSPAAELAAAEATTNVVRASASVAEEAPAPEYRPQPSAAAQQRAAAPRDQGAESPTPTPPTAAPSLRARLALGAQLALDGSSVSGQRGIAARAGLSIGRWALGAYGVYAFASEIEDPYFALRVARHAVGAAIERQVALTESLWLGFALHAGALLWQRRSTANSAAVVSYPDALLAVLSLGPELVLGWLPDRYGLSLRLGLDWLPNAPRFEAAASAGAPRISHALWALEPRITLAWESALP